MVIQLILSTYCETIAELSMLYLYLVLQHNYVLVILAVMGYNSNLGPVSI